MSAWLPYVDNLLASKNMTHVGIFGLDGQPWAQSQGFPLNLEHIKTIIAGIIDANKISTKGLEINKDERYTFIRSDPGSFMLLKKGPNGIVAYKSSQCAIVALHDDKVKAEQTLGSVGRVVDYLSKNGY